MKVTTAATASLETGSGAELRIRIRSDRWKLYGYGQWAEGPVPALGVAYSGPVVSFGSLAPSGLLAAAGNAFGRTWLLPWYRDADELLCPSDWRPNRNLWIAISPVPDGVSILGFRGESRVGAGWSLSARLGDLASLAALALWSRSDEAARGGWVSDRARPGSGNRSHAAVRGSVYLGRVELGGTVIVSAGTASPPATLASAALRLALPWLLLDASLTASEREFFDMSGVAASDRVRTVWRAVILPDGFVRLQASYALAAGHASLFRPGSGETSEKLRADAVLGLGRFGASVSYSLSAEPDRRGVIRLEQAASAGAHRAIGPFLPSVKASVDWASAFLSRAKIESGVEVRGRGFSADLAASVTVRRHESLPPESRSAFWGTASVGLRGGRISFRVGLDGVRPGAPVGVRDLKARMTWQTNVERWGGG